MLCTGGNSYGKGTTHVSQEKIVTQWMDMAGQANVLMIGYIWDQVASFIHKIFFNRCLKLLHITLPDMAIQFLYFLF